MQAIAITDDITTCDCCGRAGLKRTVVLRSDDGAIRYHGTSCAARALFGWSDAGTNRRVRQQAIAAQAAEQQRQADASRRATDARSALACLDAGGSLHDSAVLALHQVWRQLHNPIEPGPEFIPWRQWLEARAAMA